MQESSSTLPIISLVGRQGTGKTTIGNKVARKLATSCLEISTLVKATTDLPDLELAKTGDRTKEDPNWLGELVYSAMYLIKEQTGKYPVLMGVREIEVHDFLESKGLKVYPIALIADPDTRYTRLIRQGRIQNLEEFLAREYAEWHLGLKTVIRGCSAKLLTSQITKPENVATTILATISEEGAELF